MTRRRISARNRPGFGTIRHRRAITLGWGERMGRGEVSLVAIGKDGAAYRRLRALFNAGAIRELSDGQLLERFATGPPEAGELAFAALVERHGPMVLRVCRGVLADSHDARDAFQATFLVLVRKARGLWVRDSLGPWLHQVAYRVASGARATASRRGRLERRAARPPEQIGTGDLDEVVGLLHEEIERLPERFRSPVILCDLEGRTHEQAARHLGCPVGTVKSRLSRARDRLRERLEARGVAPDLGRRALLPIPPALADVTAGAAARYLATRAIAPGPVASLVQGVLRTMILSRCLTLGPALLALGATTTGLALLARGGPPVDDARPAVAPEDPSTIKVVPGKFRVTVAGRGNVEATRVRDIVSEVEGGTTIIKLKPEGSRVQEGEVLAELDSSSLRDQLVNQTIAVQGAEASYLQAQRIRELAEIAVKEYVEGSYKQDRDALAVEIELAQTGIAKAGGRLDRARLARKRLDESKAGGGPSGPSDIAAELTVDDKLEDAELSMARGRGALLLAKQRLETLEKYTRDRTTRQLEIEVEHKKSDESSRQARLELEKTKVARLERQIKACTLRAPADGLIVYANDLSRGNRPQIEEGASVRERQKILSVVDPKGPMRVNMKVPEAVVDRVERGLHARIKVAGVSRGFRDSVRLGPLELEPFVGVVDSVAPRPDASTSFGRDPKVYTTHIAVEKGPSYIRPGMTAEVVIDVLELDDVLTVPNTAVVRYGEKDHVAVKPPGGGVDWREVTLGVGDERRVEVKQGLKPGEVVAIDPTSLMSDEERRQKLGSPIPPTTR